MITSVFGADMGFYILISVEGASRDARVDQGNAMQINEVEPIEPRNG